MGFNTLVSLISVVHNGEKWIKNFEENIIEISKFNQFEIIIYDDGSNDNTVDLLKVLKKKYNFTLFSSNKNDGILIARLNSLKLSKSQFVWFIDFDDRVYSKNIAKLLTEINEDYDLINMQAIYKYKNKKILMTRHNFENLNNFNLKNLQKLVSKEVWRFIIKKKIAEKAALFPISLGEDVVFMYSILRHVSKIKIFKFPTYIYGVGNDGSSTSLYNDEIFQRKKTFDFIKNNLKNFTNENFINMLASIFYNSILFSTLRIKDKEKVKILINQAKKIKENNKIKIFNNEKIIYYTKKQQILSKLIENYFFNRIIFTLNRLR